MAKLTEEQRMQSAQCVGYVATASKTGKPNVSAKGSLRVIDVEHVLFADVASPRTIANIKKSAGRDSVPGRGHAPRVPYLGKGESSPPANSSINRGYARSRNMKSAMS